MRFRACVKEAKIERYHMEERKYTCYVFIYTYTIYVYIKEQEQEKGRSELF